MPTHRTKKHGHKDTSVSLHPLSFDEAIEALAQTPKHGDSGAEGSGNTKEHVPEAGSANIL